jgi:copper chaperone CopZ
MFMVKQRFQIHDMHCAGCTMAVEGAIEDLPGVRAANANYARQFADVEYDETKVTETEIIAAVQKAGYVANRSQ